MINDKELRYNLWHLFVVDEMKKLSTFLRCGLWCAELNSIVNFDGDVEGFQPFGVFVSCWHRSAGDPTEKAWEIFGDSGNGFALRARPSSMQAIAERFNRDGFRVRYDEVRYLSIGKEPSDPAFEVRSSHQREEEMRLAISFPGIVDSDNGIRKEKIRQSSPTSCSNASAIAQFQSITFVDNQGDEAVILPVSPVDLIEELVIGTSVSNSDRDQFANMLKGSEMASRVRP